ncbi:MAG: HAD family hydrolase [Arcobacteraceae bacterium]
MQKKLIIFDLDGTLIDSIHDIALSTNEVLERLGFKPHPLDAYKNFVGDGAMTLLKNTFGDDVEDETLEKALVLFKEIYGDKIHKNTKPYNGIYEMLESISEQDCYLAVLSNKPHEFTVEFIDHFFKKFPFVEVHGQKEEVPRKPNPQGIFNIANNLNIKLEDIIFIGDTPIDIKTAKNAGVTSVAVSWGYRGVKELKKYDPDIIAKDTVHLTKILLENNF